MKSQIIKELKVKHPNLPYFELSEKFHITVIGVCKILGTKNYKIVNNDNHKNNEYSIEIFDNNNNVIWYETVGGLWQKYEYDTNNNQIYKEYSNGFWVKYEYDKNNNLIYFINSTGLWVKYEYDKNNNKTQWEDSEGFITKYTYNEKNVCTGFTEYKKK